MVIRPQNRTSGCASVRLGIVGSTDLLCTLPLRAGLIMARHGDVSVWNLPFDLPAYTVRQHWHERQQFDPGCQWLRRAIAALFGQGAAGTG